jgi:hypothetical protein
MGREEEGGVDGGERRKEVRRGKERREVKEKRKQKRREPQIRPERIMLLASSSSCSYYQTWVLVMRRSIKNYIYIRRSAGHLGKFRFTDCWC